MKELRISPTLALPALEAQTQTLVVYGGKGMGKTNLCAVVAEELARCLLRFCWVDPVGVAWGLRYSSDGRGAGVEVLILGGRHGDIPIHPGAGALVADLVVDEPGVSVIVDISSKPDGKRWSSGEKIRFVRDFCVRLYERQGEKRQPLMLLIDEAGKFAPENPPKGAIDIMECIGAIEELVELGRNVGVGVGMFTQRSARMRKSISELAEIMVSFRVVGPRSIQAIIDWFGEHVPRERQKELVERIRELPRGVAMIVSPGWLKVEGEHTIRPRETFDTSATPVAGQERKSRGRGAAIDKAKYEERLAETIEAAKENDPGSLRKRVRELEEQLRRALAAGEKPRTIEKPVEIEKRIEIPTPFLTDADREMIRELGRQVRITVADWDAATERIDELIQTKLPRPASTATPSPSPQRAGGSPSERAERGAVRAPARTAPAAPSTVDDVDGDLPLGAAKLLAVLAQFPEGRTRKQLGVLAGYKPSGSTFRGAIAELRKRGYATAASVNPIQATEAGLAVAPTHDLPPTSGRPLYEHWHRQLPLGAQRLLEILFSAGPHGMSRDELADMAGYDATGSTFRGAIAALRNRDLVTRAGVEPIRAADELLEDA